MMTRFRNTLLATTALMPLGIIAAAANPLGSQVVGGTASVQGQGTSTVTVTQSTDRAIINWNSFNISSGETTRFMQPNASSVTLNRVTGNLGPSFLDGTMTANGRVFLVNPDGILFGAGSKINTGSFLATTNDIRNADFMAGRYQFNIPGRPDASVVNLGTITAQNGGFAALVAPGVRNTGTITANLGTVGLAAGNNFSLDFYGDRLITLGINDSIATRVIDVATGQPLSALVKNEGTLKANGGRVELTAVAARQVVDAVINNTGVIEANSIGSRNGMIVLGAATRATKPAGAPTQTVRMSGTLSAAGRSKGTNGGTIVVAGENIELAAARIDASGQTGGGRILIGGDVGGGRGNSAVATNPTAALESFAVPTASTVSVDAATTIDVSAKATGDGGKVVLWSDQATTFHGTIRAQGGLQSGNGGFVETSGHQSLTFNGLVDTSAPRGVNGTLLLDPQDALITTNAGVGVVTVSSIQAALANGDVVVTTGSSGSDLGDITVAANISWANANVLTLSAYRDIVVNANISNTGGSAVNLRADNTGNGVGTVSFGGGATISTSGAVSIFYNPSVNPANSLVNSSSYVNPTESFAGNVTGGGTLTAYMLVNSVYDLQNIQNNLFGIYALGKDIDASATANWNGGAGFLPIGGPFAGVLDGQGHVVGSLAITSAEFFVGLFGTIGSTGIVRNLGLTNALVVGTAASDRVGILAGQLYNGASVFNSYATGTVTGGSTSLLPSGTLFSEVGGLVGISNGTISGSYTNVAVSGGVVADVGGLVGSNDGTIIQSYAMGSVNGSFIPLTFGASVGALTGCNCFGTIIQSYAIGSVSGDGSAGGLIGRAVLATTTNSYWDTQTTNQPVSDGGTGMPTSQLKSGLPSGFDPSVWGSNPNINNGYPYLLWTVATDAPSTATTLFPAPGSGPAPTPTPPQSLLPPGTSPFSTGQTVFFTPANMQVANSTTQSILPTYPVSSPQNATTQTPSQTRPGSDSAKNSLLASIEILHSGPEDLPKVQPLSQKLQGDGYQDPTVATSTDTIAGSTKRTEVQNLACLATVYTMIDRALGNNSSIDTFYPDPRKTSTDSTAGAIKPNYVGSTVPLNVNAIVGAIQEGKPTILHGEGGPLKDHYVLVVGAQLDANGKVELKIIDPWSTTPTKPYVMLSVNSSTGSISYPALGVVFVDMRAVSVSIN